LTSNWNLNFIYKGYDDPNIEEDLKFAEDLADELSSNYKGKILSGELSSQELNKLLQQMEEVFSKITITGAYSFLLFSQETTNDDFKALYDRMQQKNVEISNKLLWARLEIGKMEEEVAKRYLGDPQVKNYHHLIQVERLNKPYLLSESEEKILAEKNLVGALAWYNFYSEFTAAFKFELEIEGEMKTLSTGEIYPLFRDSRPEVRKAAFQTYYQKYADNQIPITHSFNNIWKNHGQNINLRQYPATMTIAHIRNEVDEEIVTTMMDVVRKNYDLVQDYYKTKARALGQGNQIGGSDLYAPLGKDIRYTWEEAKKMVLESFSVFDSEIGEMAKVFFDRNLIDSEVRKTKMTGAYCYGIDPKLDPVIHMSFNGTTDSVSTLAHEMGHGLHDMFSAKNQTVFNYHPPLVIAETASVFGEQMLIEKMLKELPDAEAKLKLLGSQVEDAILTISRQTMYVFWEKECHDAGRALSSQEMSDMWDKHVKEAYGDAVAFLPEQSWNWATIPHFLDPRIFYCYAYSFGMLFVLGLYQKYLQEGEAFIPKYKAILEAGGSTFPVELAKSVGLDVTKPDFWQAGFDYLKGLLKEFQEVVAQQTS
jgi:oligoendopeptidase F